MLKRHNGIIIDAEKERDSLKGLAKLTGKVETQPEIDRKNEEIALLKVGLSGLAKRYVFRRCMIFIKLTLLLGLPMQNIGRRLTNGKKNMVKIRKCRNTKACRSSCGMINGKVLGSRRSRPSKTEITVQDDNFAFLKLYDVTRCIDFREQ